MRHWVVLLALAASCLPAADKYFVYESEHFELITDGPRGRAQNVLAHFERVRSFFETMLNLRAPILKPRIVMFNNEKDYQDHAGNKNTAAYYIGLPQRDYIAMSPAMTEAARRTAVHEYIHLLVHYSDMRVPIWLNEGIAELYSNVEQVKKSIRVGTPIAGHVYLIRNSWIPLAEVTSADHQSKLYNRREHMGPFYGISWALTHMLSLDQRYRPGFRKLSDAMTAGATSEEAFQQVYQKSITQVEADLKAYIEGSRVNVVNFDIQFEKVDEKVEPRQVTDYEWGVATADLLGASHRADQAAARLEALTNMAAQRPEAWESLALIRWRAGQSGSWEAFQKARSLGSEHPHLAFWAGQFGKDSGVVRESLARTLEKYPDYAEARLRLSGSYLKDGDPAKAFAQATLIKKIHPALVGWYFPVYIQAAYYSGKVAEARAAADQFARVANKKDKALAEEMRLLAAKDPRKTASQPARIVESRAGLATQFEEFVVEEPPPVPLSFLSGTLVELQCGEPASLHIQSGEAVVKLAIDDPKNLQLAGAAGGMGELQCGAQKRPVKLGYVPGQQRADGAAGIARTIEFLP